MQPWWAEETVLTVQNVWLVVCVYIYSLAINRQAGVSQAHTNYLKLTGQTYQSGLHQTSQWTFTPLESNDTNEQVCFHQPLDLCPLTLRTCGYTAPLTVWPLAPLSVTRQISFSECNIRFWSVSQKKIVWNWVNDDRLYIKPSISPPIFTRAPDSSQVDDGKVWQVRWLR